MKVQPVSKADERDVDRIIRRDFAHRPFEEVKTLVDRYGIENWEKDRVRVQMAALKLADGRLDELVRWIDLAKQDFRDVIAPAEYPTYLKRMFKVENLPAPDREKIITDDWKQYEDWLKR